MDIPINAEVHCSDGPFGTLSCVIINPITKKVTDVAVREKHFPHLEVLVPLNLISHTKPDLVQLSCTRAKLRNLESFTEIQFIPGNDSYHDFDYDYGQYQLWPYVEPDEYEFPFTVERIPYNELGFHKGAKVRDKDDHRIGTVDEFLINPDDGHITHLVLREGHLWGQKDVTIPVSGIREIDDDVVYLQLDKHELENLPAIPVRRKHKTQG
jgi:sporulation protein YlmC with PRC-barrel domain